jgi:hypothetical protein
MIRHSLLLGCALALPGMLLAQEPTVKVEPPDLHGSRSLEPQTATAVVRDYLQAWQSLRSALDQNQASLLKTDFIGTAQSKLSETIADQAKAGIHTRYQDRAHDLQVIFYSPEGGSIQMTDNISYDEQVFGKDKVLATQSIQTRYLVVMTPSEGRWRVRILQADPHAISEK